MKKSAVLPYFVSSVSRRFGLQVRKNRCRFACAMKESTKNKNFVVRALKTKQVGNVFSLCDCQENPTLIKYFKWRKIKRPLKLYI